MDVAVRWNGGFHALQDMRRHGRPGGEDALECRQHDLVVLAEASDDVPERRGAEGLCDFPIVDVFDDFFGIDTGRARGIHVGDDRRHAHCTVEESEERKTGEIDLAGLDAVEVPDFVGLLIEVAVAIENAFGRAGATRSENDGGRIVEFSLDWLEVFVEAAGTKLRDCFSAPEPAAADGDVVFCLWKAAAQYGSYGLSERNPDKTF